VHIVIEAILIFAISLISRCFKISYSETMQITILISALKEVAFN
jgi:hypothetical protein